MKIHRRLFLAAAAAQAMLLSSQTAKGEEIPTDLDEQYARRSGVPILQGMTHADRAELIVLVSKEEPLRFRALDSQDHEVSIQVIETHSVDFSEWTTIKLLITGLQLGEIYRLQVFDDENELEDEREFTSLDLNKPTVRFGLVSCMHDLLVLFQKSMWRGLADKQPEILFMIGDEVYVDWGSDSSPNGIWKRYEQVRRRLELFYLKKLIPTVSVWDDHDYGKNNEDGTFAHKDFALKTFHAFYGSSESNHYIPGPGNSKLLRAFGQQFYFLDDRYFSSPIGATPQDQWGSAQELWLQNSLNSSTDPAWLFNGIQFWGAYHTGESVERHRPDALSRMVQIVRGSRAPVVFGCGDMHFTEIQKLEDSLVGYETYELMSSGIHNVCNPLEAAAKNPRRLAGAFAFNFMIIESKPDVSAHNFRVDSWGLNGHHHFGMDLKIGTK